MRNLLVEICYQGTAYHGYQVQKNACSVMETLQDSIERVIGRREPVVGCSRTDTGVHANSYYFGMKTESPIRTEQFLFAMNNALPEDIAVLSCREVPLEFHPRYDCIAKEYIYQVYDGPIRDPFLSPYSLYHRRPVQEKLLEEKAQALVGKHDFTSFCSLNGKDGSRVRTVSALRFSREGSLVRMSIEADGFLYNMVRIIVGTLLFMNDGRIDIEALPGILASKDRSRAGKTAPPQGLFLNRVRYKDF